MRDLIIEQIERRARLDHCGDVNKAAAEYFRDHPTEWQCYTKKNRFAHLRKARCTIWGYNAPPLRN